ncbi:aminoglycoside phosphotransferase like [Lecanosticta acicola]|uniref:Aminoglycoside phosphotransferase like n=1 Tax=Lecanosticta acicola TaxID=111012 RepID=A0AAI8Z856_9PEZI|nr:aminoglycoside phosphotransferase like [Lecanosticta acicola]
MLLTGEYKMTACLPLPPTTSVNNTKANMSTSSKSPDRASVQQVAKKALQTKSVSVERLEGSVFRTFRLQPPSDYFYVLRCRPSSHVRLLRHEEGRVQIEASILQTLRGRSDILIPRLIESHSTSSTIGSYYLISGPFRGASLADIEPQLSRDALASVDRSVGRYVRQLKRLPPGRAFGAITPTSGTAPTTSWYRCFGGMLENLLRDAEDALVSLPYEFIRDQVRRHQKVLDQITEPKLTLLEMYTDKNIVVDTSSYTVSGLMDWSSAMWADPYISDCFYRCSYGFESGFGSLPNRNTDERIRQYLYTLYHALAAVVRLCYRPSEDGDEMAARRDLTAALSKLSSLSR